MTNTLLDAISAIVQVVLAVASPVVAVATPAMFDPAAVVIPRAEQCISLSGPLLGIGSSGSEVIELQRILNLAPDTRLATSGSGSPGNETAYFGSLTKSAVMRFQAKYASEILAPGGFSAPTGMVGLYTRAKMRSICETIKTSGMTQDSFMAGAWSAYNKFFKTNSSTSATSSSSRTAGTKTLTPVTSTLKPATSTSTTTTSKPATTTTSATTSTTTPAKTSTTTTNSAATKLQWGAFSGYSSADLTTFETLVGKQVNMKAVFTNWNEPFPTYAVSGLKASNKTLVIFWEQYGVTLDSLIAGNSDAYIKKFAAEAKAYGGPVILAPFHEMNGNWDPWGGASGQNTPQKVVSAWKRVHDAFGTVSNVKFAWAVNNVSVPDTTANAIEKYYPGDTYVDYVAVDGFNFGSPWQSFDQIFGGTLKTVSTYKKPIYILSMASAQGDKKAAWIKDAFTVQAPKYPLLKGWVWFNENKEKDWRIDSDLSALSAFRASLP